MVCRDLDPKVGADHSEEWGRACGTLVVVGPGEAEVAVSFAVLCDLCGPRQVGRKSGCCRGARLCRGCSPFGPAGPGVTGRRREASSPGYNAARVKAAAPPSSPEEPAPHSARAEVVSAPTLSNPASLA
ncbi:hypothetical protein NN561_002440 [Cricetulus griseus]